MAWLEPKPHRRGGTPSVTIVSTTTASLGSSRTSIGMYVNPGPINIAKQGAHRTVFY